MSYCAQHLRETAEIVSRLNPADCEKWVAELRTTREGGGRLFFLGVAVRPPIGRVWLQNRYRSA